MPMRLDTHVILPAQFFARVHADRSQPEKRLMAAVLEDAIAIYRRCAGRPKGRARRLFVEVQAWLEACHDPAPFAFTTICDVLGLDASSIRSALRRELAAHAAARRVLDNTGGAVLAVSPARSAVARIRPAARFR